MEVTDLEPAALSTLRSERLGFIFQGFNLLPRMTALENVMLPMVYAGTPGDVRQERAMTALVSLGLETRAAPAE